MIDVLPWGEFDENTLVVGDAAECVVIDPGAPAARILPLVKGRRVVAFLLTHTHLDHILGVDELRDALPGVPLLVPAGEKDGLTDPRVNLSAYYGSEVRRRPAEGVVRGGESIRVGSFSLEVRDTPGHSPGHVIYVGPGFVIAGDTLFAGSIGRTDFPGSSHEILLESIRRELLTLPDATAVHPGHGPSTSIGTERRYNPFLEGLS